MVFGKIVPSTLGSLSPQQALNLANVYLENANNSDDRDIALVLCHDTDVSLYQAKKRAENQTVIDGIVTAYIGLGKQLETCGHNSEAQAIYKKAEKLGWNRQDPGLPIKSSRPSSITQSLKGKSHSAGGAQSSGTLHHFDLAKQNQRRSIATVPAHIFAKNVRPRAIEFKLPESDERLNSTPQLVCCLGLLQLSHSSEDIIGPAARKWLQVIEKDTDEQDRLNTMAMDVIRAYKRDELKDAKVVSEVVCLAPVLNKKTFQDLLGEFYSGIDHSGLLNFDQLAGLAQLIQEAETGHLSADDLVKILGRLSTRLRDTHQQSENHMHQLTLAVSHVLDAMADVNVQGMDRVKLHEPLSEILGGLKDNSDPYLVYQAAYAYQALLCLPDNESTWKAAMRRTGKVFRGVSGLVSAVKGLDLNKFIEGLEEIQKGFAGTSKVVELVATAYKDATSLAQSGKGFFNCLKEGFSFDRKRDWYTALRGADTLIRDGELASLRILVCESPCRLDPAFQWGVCQRLGEIAANPSWDADIRRSAIAFLGDIYKNDAMWGQQASVKQWILNILMQLSTSSGTGAQFAEITLQELQSDGDVKKQALYGVCRENGPISYPLRVAVSEMTSPSLLDRVQNRPDVEGNLRLLRKQRTKERGDVVYIPPQAKAGLQAGDGERFPLMEKVKEFLESDRKVFLLLGDSGSGKSTFNRELEFDLWQSYKNNIDPIPLHINLPAIDKPEHDMIAKQLRKFEFTEPQIREMKYYRKFILICDGYDESQQTHNLYMSNRLNQPGEWDARMVIGCRSEYLGTEYRDRFQPGDRNQQSDSSLLQEAVITPFSHDQVQAYIKQYVSVHQPLWQTDNYKQALELIPSLKELVRNPFLMTLSLEVLPRMVDPGQHLSTTRVTRMGLYDHFIDQWFERSKKRLREKDLSPQSRAVFENLSNEGFTQNGTDFLKKLAMAIYENQDGHPVVKYSRAKDEGSWKAEFFCREEEKQLLREACPLTRSGNQYRFIHRSLLEYGLALAVFDPQDWKEVAAPELTLTRRGSTSSTLSFEIFATRKKVATSVEQEPILNSPLVSRSFVNDQSLLQFLEERVQQEPLFKQQLFTFIEHSKTDKKWRTAASNAITILVRAGVQFIGADFQGIQIPGADLSYGVFDSVQLQEADLRKVNLRGVWLRQTDLSRAQMTGVQFGELPLLTQDYVVRSCSFSPDGKFLAIGLFNGDISVYTTSTWERTRILSGHSNIVLRIAYSPKGDQIASASEDNTVRLWDMDTGECRHILAGHTLCVYGVAFSPQGHQLASGGHEGTVRLWDVYTGDCRQTLSGHSKEVLCVIYSPNGHQIVSCSTDYTIRLWNPETGICTLILSDHSSNVWEIAYSPRGNQIASASLDKTVRLWDVETGICRHILTGHGSHVYSVAYSPNGGQVVSGGMDATVRLWDVETGICRHTLIGHSDTVFSVAYSPKGDQVASGSGDKIVRLWDVSAGASPFVSSGHSGGVYCIKHSPTGEQIASCSMDHTIRLWDAESGTCRRILRGHTNTVFSVAYSSQGDLIASGSGDNSVRLWDVASRVSRHTLTGHSDMVLCVTYSPQGHVIASASLDKTVRLWDVENGDCSGTLHGHTDGITSVAYSPDGKLIASGSKDTSVRLWDAGTLACRQTLQGHRNWVWDVVFSPHGYQLASASNDCTVRLWDVKTGDCSRTLTGHSLCVYCVTYSPKGDLLASGSMDKTVRLWDVASGQCRAVIENFQGDVRGMSWRVTLDANYLVTGSEDASVLMWKVVEEADQCHVSLEWSATSGALIVTGASMQDVRGLTQLNKQLLKQRGAIGEPEYLLHEPSKKLITTASVVSKLKQPSDAIDSLSVLFLQSSNLNSWSDRLNPRNTLEWGPRAL